MICTILCTHIIINTVFWGKMSPIIQFFEVCGKIMDFGVEGLYNVLNGVTRGHFNIFNTWLKSATPIFDFQGSTNFISPIKIYWGIY